MAYLLKVQNTDGSWGDAGTGTGLRDTATVLDTLTLLEQGGQAYSQGITALTSMQASNNNGLARQVYTLARVDHRGQLQTLLDTQEQPTLDFWESTYPGRFWGFEAGSDVHIPTTALGLRALQAVGLDLGLTIVFETLGSGQTSDPRTFLIPNNASDLTLLLYSTTQDIRVLLDVPSGARYRVPHSPQPNPMPVLVPTGDADVGTWYLLVENLADAEVAYHYEVQYTASDTFGLGSDYDLSHTTTAASYLAMHQNPDGGWGEGLDDESEPAATAEVLITLHNAGSSFGPFALLENGAVWLAGQQQSDGGFGPPQGPSTVLETALALYALTLVTPDAPAVLRAVAFLRQTQSADGSWGQDAYLTALALRGLVGAEPMLPGPVLDVDDNGRADALTDTVLLLRTMLGWTGKSLIDGALGDDCGRCGATLIADHIRTEEKALDIDHNGVTEVSTDGLLAMRYLLGLRGEALLREAVDLKHCNYCDSADIEAYIQFMLP